MLKWIKRLLYGPKPDARELDKLAVARPIHEGFEKLAERLSGKGK